jgi:Ca-activated chloride channel homolog
MKIPLCSTCVTLIAVLAWTTYGQERGGSIKVDAFTVEVYATIYDRRNQYMDNLTRDRFEIREDGKPQQIVSFETNVGSLSCAILLDTTGSMNESLPRVKNSIVKLIDALGPEDSVAVYTFNERLVVNQEFTADKNAAKRAVLRTRAQGRTALFDAIAQTTEDISKRAGKKALLVFSDGDDNASMLSGRSAVLRAQKIGVPLYAIAEGAATKSRRLETLLQELSKQTGGAAYRAKNADDIEEVFQQISENLRHLYMLSYQPASLTLDGKWRKIELLLTGVKGYRIRGKEGYYPN